MTPLVLRRAAKRIAERFSEAVGRAFKIRTERRAAGGVVLGVRTCRGVSEHPFDVSTQLGQLLRADDVFEYVESERPIGVQNIAVKFAVRTQANRSAIAEGLSACDPF